MDAATAEGLTRGQMQALDELRAVSAVDPRALEVVQVSPRTSDGWLPIEISVAAARPGGADPPVLATGQWATMRARERFIVRVPPQFPFMRPEVDVTHTRFAGLPHVQWQHRICLYLSPSTEWHPADGMFGLLERLLSWIDQAAVGALDPAGAPLHPPVAYATRDGGAAIIRADTPRGIALPWVGYAVFKQAQGRPIELVAWLGGDGAARLLAAPSVELLEVLTGFNAGKKPLRLGVAVLLAEPAPFEFPMQGDDVLNLLTVRGVSRERLLDALAQVSFLNRHVSLVDRASRQSLYAVLGTPGRGVAGGDLRQHLTVWRLPADAPLAASELEQADSLAHAAPSVHTQVRNAVSDWLAASRVDWAQVYEQRPEVTVRRDSGSPLEWARGRTIAIIGCGALGGHIAEHFARAGAVCLKLFDNGTVSPGVLVRQPYGHADVGTAKVTALCAHLHRVRSDLTLSSNSADALQVILRDTGWPPEVDLIVDAAANPAITAALERQRRRQAETTPPILTLIIGHTAHRGVATLAPQGYSGAGADLLRKVKLSVVASPALAPFADDFFPDPPRATLFQPEPGCSEATFVGSHAEVAALTGTLLIHALTTLATPPPREPSGQAVLFDLGLERSPAILRRLTWPNDIRLRDEAEDVEVRISPVALAEMRAECRLMARRRSWRTETGGVLQGELDQACGVAWITAASGPPPDSHASERLFVCGVEGVRELLHQRKVQTRGSVQLLGYWHCHPGGRASPSDIDEAGIGDVVAAVSDAPRRALLLILGAAKSTWMAWLDDEKDASQLLPGLYTRLERRVEAANPPTPAAGSAYSRALAAADQRDTRRWPPAAGRRAKPRPWWRWRRWSRDP